MTESFGSEFSHLDDARAPDALLAFLDRVAALPAVRDVKAATTAALQLQPDDRVLDVGCGTGIDLPEMLVPTLPGGKVVGVDVSERAIGVAAGRLADHPEISVLVADVHDLPFEDGSFEVVRADRVLLHLARPEQALAEIRRVLVPSGKLAILEMAMSLEGAADLVGGPTHRVVSNAFWDLAQQSGRIELFLPLLLAQAGFVETTVERGGSESADFEAANVLLRLEEGAKEAVGGGRLAGAEAAEWLEAVRGAFEAGAARLRTTFTCYLGRAPA